MDMSDMVDRWSSRSSVLFPRFFLIWPPFADDLHLEVPSWSWSPVHQGHLWTVTAIEWSWSLGRSWKNWWMEWWTSWCVIGPTFWLQGRSIEKTCGTVLQFFAAKTTFYHNGGLFSCRLSSLRFCRQLLLPNAPESLDKYLGGMEHDGTLEALSLIWRCWRGRWEWRNIRWNFVDSDFGWSAFRGRGCVVSLCFCRFRILS